MPGTVHVRVVGERFLRQAAHVAELAGRYLGSTFLKLVICTQKRLRIVRA